MQNAIPKISFSCWDKLLCYKVWQKQQLHAKYLQKRLVKKANSLHSISMKLHFFLNGINYIRNFALKPELPRVDISEGTKYMCIPPYINLPMTVASCWYEPHFPWKTQQKLVYFSPMLLINKDQTKDPIRLDK